jgi:hypothetical protein
MAEEGTIMGLQLSKADRERIARIYYGSVPGLVLVGVLYWTAVQYGAGGVQWGAAGVGALGWLVALVLRQPVGLVGTRLPATMAERLVVFSSGPLEEGVRVAALFWAGRDFTTALSLGFGWAMIEVVYVMQTCLVIAGLVKKTDEKSQQALTVLKERGMLSESPNAWGAVERLFASALHVGNTLLLAVNPWLALVTAPVHSAANWVISRMVARSVAKAELLMAVLGTVTLVMGLGAFR